MCTRTFLKKRRLLFSDTENRNEQQVNTGHLIILFIDVLRRVMPMKSTAPRAVRFVFYAHDCIIIQKKFQDLR